MGSSLAWGNVKSRQPGLRQPFDREKWELLESHPKTTARERHQFARAEYLIGCMMMERAGEKKAAGGFAVASGLYSGAVARFNRALLSGPESKLKKEIESKLREATLEMLECERLLQEKSGGNKPS